jgi:hypothetical protein
MNKCKCVDSTAVERLDLAKRSGQLLLSLAGKSGNDRLADAICRDNLVVEIIEGKHSLPIKGLQWLRALEAQVDGIDWFAPSLLAEVAVAFQSHIGGTLSSQARLDLDDLERKAQHS